MPRRAKPILGVTGPDRGGAAAWWFTRFAVWRAGGRAVRITPRRPRAIDALDGLIVGGGADLDPKLYGQELLHVAAHKLKEEPLHKYLLNLVLLPFVWLIRKLAALPATTIRGDAARDALEMSLIDAAVRRRLPILGICRGSQLLNVYFGGTLHQGLDAFYVEDPEMRTILPRKRIALAGGATLCAVLGDNPGRVNALHRQAIDRLGDGLRVACRDRNGIVQGIEHVALPFVVGVQWHPEYLPQVRQQRAIFKALVRNAAREDLKSSSPAVGQLVAAAIVAALLPLSVSCSKSSPPPSSPHVADVGTRTGSLDNHEIGGIVFDTPLDWSGFTQTGDGTFTWRKRDPRTNAVLVERTVRQPFEGRLDFGRAKAQVDREFSLGGARWTDRRTDLEYAHTQLLKLDGDSFAVLAIVRGVESPTLWLHSLVVHDTTETRARALGADMLASLRAKLPDGTNPPRRAAPPQAAPPQAALTKDP